MTLWVSPTDPTLTMFEMLGRSAEDQQSQPLALPIGGHVVQTLADGLLR